MKQLLEFFDFQPGEVVASLGASGGFWEVGFGAAVPGLTFYLVERSPDLLNESELAAAVTFWEKQTGRPVESKFLPVIGTETATCLPSHFFDKILIINSFHEFINPDAMLAECQRILKPDGVLFLEEPLAKVPGELHGGCGRRLFTETELTDFLKQAGFSLRQSVSRDGTDFWTVFEYTFS
ncbi:MAG: class I SAM-dependent methyltransferase [Cytophagaceae bacterium]|nr:class I SAM-dependent methyltransferase [Cytophagaceae bacterium]